MAEETPSLFGTILVPVDFSVSSAYVFCVAAKLAAANPARLAAMYVVPARQFWSSPPRAILGWAALEEEAFEAQRLPASWLSRCVAAGVEANVLVQPGMPGTGLLAAARLLETDLIVLPWKRQDALRRWMTGSVGTEVVREAPCAALATTSDMQSLSSTTIWQCAHSLVEAERNEHASAF